RNYAEHEYNGEPTIVVNSWDISYFYVIRNAYGEKSAGLISFRNSEDHRLEEFADLCRKCDYILIGDYDDDFHDNYWSRLSDTACYNSTLYRIIHDGDDFRFEMVYGFEAMTKGSGQ
ncbi:MAG: hypothetical protein IKE38_02430, partial [Erysipelotrichaceae bacterium]|nr:hypothetical protein [Erysipelotrichaceae bacterium]